jgi:GT2 family glycosyltransferase
LSEALAVVVVTYDSAADLPGLVAALLPQLVPDDEVVLVDNASSDATLSVARSLDARISVLERASNDGFAAAARAGIDATAAPLILLLNPDAGLAPGALERLRAVATERPEWSAWQPAVMLPDGAINSSGGVVHYLAIGWAGQCGQPAASLADVPHEIAFASGAALVIRRDVWQQVGGFDASYFLYGEDLDLGLRLWLTGHRVGIEPRARVIHRYEFDKGNRKFFLLERNRWRTLLAVYPTSLLVVLAPALIAVELGLLVIAARDGWLRAKLRAQLATLTGFPAALRRRKQVQAHRQITAASFAVRLTPTLDSPYLSSLPRTLDRAQACYWRLVRLLVR